MKKTFTYLAIALTALSCNRIEPETVQYGEISVALGEPDVEVVTKAATPLDKNSEEAKKYLVTIYEKSTGEDRFSSSYYDFEKAVLPLGSTYYVVAETCTETEAEIGNGQMRVTGTSADVELNAGNMSVEVPISCTLVNGKISVVFDSSVDGKFDNLQVVLSRTSPARTLTVTSDTETWFNPSVVSYSITGRFNAGGVQKDVEKSGTINLAARNHVKLVVKVNLTNGQILVNPTITTDTTIDSTTDKTETFNPYN